MAPNSSKEIQLKKSQCLEPVRQSTSWEDITCPICLDFPHNGVLLQCSSFGKGCRPFLCDTDHLHSNCLERYKAANGVSKISDVSEKFGNKVLPTCPLCRGEVSGWVVIEEARTYLNKKTRFCLGEKCNYSGNYTELEKHAKLNHPHCRPSEIDPARRLDWENFQQSSEIIDVLSTIHSEVPRGVVLGDYVIEYGEDDSGDDFENLPRDEGNWWTSCILYFDSLRPSRNRRRARVSDARRGRHRSNYDTSNSDDGSVTSVDMVEYRVYETQVDLASRSVSVRGGSVHRRCALFLNAALYFKRAIISCLG